MSCLKRIFLTVSIFLLSVFLTACRTDSNYGTELQDVDFREFQRVQVITEKDVFNVLVKYDEAEKLYLEILDESPDALLGCSVEIAGGKCVLKNSGIDYVTSLDNFNEDFMPAILYFFFYDTDFSNQEYKFNKNEKTYSFEKSVSGKTVVFCIQLSLDETTQNYILEIK
ncbi:MAG: hypothetical protein IKC01_04915 [Clostridia bacterium]|nr:hypothetical protein [Clostridia bacterium]